MPYTGFCYTSKQTYVFQTILSELLRITSYLFFVLDLSARSWWFLFLFIIVHYQYVFSEFSDYFYIFAPKWDFVSTYTPQLAITLSKWAIETPVQCGNLFKVMTSTSFCCLYCELWIDFTHCSGISIFDYKQVNAGWVDYLWFIGKILIFIV